jgi:hypothetical protein
VLSWNLTGKKHLLDISNVLFQNPFGKWNIYETESNLYIYTYTWAIISHRLGDLTVGIYFVIGLEVGKSKSQIKVLVNWFHSKAFSWLVGSHFYSNDLLYVLCKIQASILVSLFLKGTNSVRSKLHPMISFYLNYFLRDPIFQHSHNKCWVSKYELGEGRDWDGYSV